MRDLGSRRQFARLDSATDQLRYAHVVLAGLFVRQELGSSGTGSVDALDGFGCMGIVPDVEPGTFLGYRVDLGELSI